MYANTYAVINSDFSDDHINDAIHYLVFTNGSKINFSKSSMDDYEGSGEFIDLGFDQVLYFKDMNNMESIISLMDQLENLKMRDSVLN